MTTTRNSIPVAQPWPSSHISWQINGTAALPQLQLQFGFNSHIYEGLHHLSVTEENTLTAAFTSALNATTATDPINYSVSAQREEAEPVNVKISSVVLNDDGKSVTITVDGIDKSKDHRLQLSIANIVAADGSTIFSGKAECNCSGSDETCTSPVTVNAQRDLQFYAYLIADPTGVEPVKLSVESTLVKQELIISPQQFVVFKKEWLAPLCAFLADRADGKTAIPVPVKTHSVTLDIDITHLHSGDLFRLGCSLLMHRGAMWNMLDIQPYTETNVAPFGFQRFAAQLERVLQNENWVFRVLQQIVKSENSDAVQLWAVRKGLQADQPISFSIDNGTPKLFAVKPVSNRSENLAHVPIYDFNPATGIDFTSPTRQMNFSSTDMDEWMKTFFRSVDILLSPGYANAIRLVDAKSGTNHHSVLWAQRLKLADIVSKWLIPLFENDASDTQVVQESFRKKLQAELSCAYHFTTAVQLNASVVSDLRQDTPTLFSGPVTLVSDTSEKKTLSLTFTPGELNVESGSDRPFTFMVGTAQALTNNNELVCTTKFRSQYSVTRIGNHEAGSADPWWTEFITEEGNKSFSTGLEKLQLPVLLGLSSAEMYPTLSEQSARPSEPPAEATFDSLFDWNYSLRYSRPVHAPHDTLSFTLDFSGQKHEAVRANVPTEVFAPLAQFAMVFPMVERVFTGTLGKIDDRTDPSQLAACDRALNAFTKMSARIVSGVEGQVPLPAQNKKANDAFIYRFDLKEGKAMIDNVEALLITITGKAANSNGTPTVLLDDCATFAYTENPQGDFCFYFKDRNDKIVTASEGQFISMRTIVVQRLNIMHRQIVKTQLDVSRNAELIPGKLTADPFVYRIGPVENAAACHPFIEHHAPVDVSLIYGEGKSHVVSLIEHFEHLFIAILRQSQQPLMSLEIDCRYSYQIAEGISDVTIPVIRLPYSNIDITRRPYALGDITLQKVIEKLAEEIKRWYANYQPETKGASFTFDIFFYSMLTGEPRPLLRLRSLSLGIVHVTDL